jgi:hypothetical protein
LLSSIFISFFNRKTGERTGIGSDATVHDQQTA